MARLLVILATLALVTGTASASSCPVLDTTTANCQKAVAKGGAGYAKSALKAMQRCLRDIQTGALVGDPATVCTNDPPSDQKTADALANAASKLATKLGKCDDATVANLQLCAPTVSGLATCLAADSRARVVAALDAAYGAVVASGDKDEQKCQQTLGKETTKLVTSRLKAVQRCLNSRNKDCGGSDPLARCLAPRSDSASPTETTAAASIAKAEDKFRAKVHKSCTDTQVTALDACADTVGTDPAPCPVCDCLICATSNSADLLAGGQYRAVRVAGPTNTLQAAADAAETEDTILVEPGTYTEEVTLKDGGITVRGLKECSTGQRPLVLPPIPTSDNGFFWCGSRLGGCTDPADGVLMQSLEVNDFHDNDVLTVGVVGVTYRDMVTRGPGMTGVTEYGLFPVQSDGVLIDSCLASGISDAALYVGQSINIVVRDSEVYGSVAGIEIENSANAEVFGNYAHDNAGGILIFKLAGLPVQTSDCHYIHDNRSENNNGTNYGEGIVGDVPSGTGIVVLSNDSGIVENNTVTGNKTLGIVIVDQEALNVLIAPPPFPTTSPDQDVEDNAFRGNTVTGNAYDPDPAVGTLARDILFAPFVHSGNCQDGNTFGTQGGFVALPACPATLAPRPGCPFIVTTTTTTTSTTTTTLPTPTWTEIYSDIIATNCVACHGGGGGLAMGTKAVAYANLINVPSTEVPAPGMDRVEPGDSTLSYLMHKIDGTQLSVPNCTPGLCGNQMPLGGPFLTQAQRDGIRAWIDEGALDN